MRFWARGVIVSVEMREMGKERIWRWSYRTCQLFTCFPEGEGRIQQHTAVSNLLTGGGEQKQVWKGRFWVWCWIFRVQVHMGSLGRPYAGSYALLLLLSTSLYCSPHNRPTSREELLGQGLVTLFGKPVDQEDGGLVSQWTIFPESEFRLLLC